MQKNLKFYLNKALKEGFALGAFNFCNFESLKGIVEGASAQNAPAIISVSEGALSYMGEEYMIAMANVARKNKGIFLHLDHGKSFEIAAKAIDLGFNSVMIDGSALDFDENVTLTKRVCDYAHARGVLVEGELGQIKGIEDNVSASHSHFTDPIKAKEFVKKTGVDLLAVAVGTSHGAYKYSGAQALKFDILDEIVRLVPKTPLVLHGASTVDQNLIDQINKFGGNIVGAKGVSAAHIKKAIKNYHVVKINTDTDIRMATTGSVRKVLAEHPDVFDPRTYNKEAILAIKNLVSNKIKKTLLSSDKL